MMQPRHPETPSFDVQISDGLQNSYPKAIISPQYVFIHTPIFPLLIRVWSMECDPQMIPQSCRLQSVSLMFFFMKWHPGISAVISQTTHGRVLLCNRNTLIIWSIKLFLHTVSDGWSCPWSLKPFNCSQISGFQMTRAFNTMLLYSILVTSSLAWQATLKKMNFGSRCIRTKVPLNWSRVYI